MFDKRLLQFNIFLRFDVSASVLLNKMYAEDALRFHGLREPPFGLQVQYHSTTALSHDH